MPDIAAPYKRYNGGKSGNGTYQQIINHFPPMLKYYEVFVGNGGIFRHLRLPETTVINDLDGSVIEKYQHLKSDSIFVFNENALDLLAEIKDEGPTSLIYCDPPYRFAARKSQRNLYKYEMTDLDHLLFLTLANNCKCNIVISHYPDKMYDANLQEWNTHDFKIMTHTGLVTDRIYYNFPKPLLLQDYRYIGNDYREREIIKRKTNRWLRRLQSMNELQRISILSSIAASFSDTSAALLHHQKNTH